MRAVALRETIDADLKRAMLDKDEVARDTLRAIKSELMNREIELGRDVDSAEELAVLKRAVKTRLESAEQYEAGSRKDLAERERAQIAIVERYLPKQLDEAATREAMLAIAKELGLSSKKEMGRLMKEINARFQGQVDGKTASKIAGEILS